jgi:hypothetical protein
MTYGDGEPGWLESEMSWRSKLLFSLDLSHLSLHMEVFLSSNEAHNSLNFKSAPRSIFS